MNRRLIAAGALVLALGGAACGGDGPTTPAGSTGNDDSRVPDACKVLTVEEVKVYTVSDPGEARTQQVIASRSVCAYTGGSTFGVSEANQFDGTIKAGEQAGFKYEDVGGVGEKAKFTVVSGSVVQIVAVQGKYMIDITLVMSDKDEAKARDAVIRWTKQAFAKLG